MVRLAIGLVPALAAMVALTPARAEACGGTFCDSGPNAMPVDQTGEHILFVMGPDYVEAHIEINYEPTPEAEQFAWIVPLQDVPEFSVGSDPLFDQLRAGSVPQYGFQSTSEGCPTTTAASGFATSGGDTGGGGDSTGGGGGPEVLLEETVGAFDVVVLQGGTAESVMTWLGMNGYQQDPAAEPILAEYLAEGFLFAAFRLANDAESDEIHPVVLRFTSNEACVPIRLTRIAAVDDMDVRAFFLADNRIVPETYKHVLVNPLRLDWPNLAGNYKEVISLAVDADMANGHAFVTEYAGPSNVVSQAGIYSPSWNPDAFVGLDAVDVIDTLEAQGLVQCGFVGGTTGGNGEGCAYGHPLLRGLLNMYLPVPVGVDEIDFYGCLSCFAADIDTMAWGDGSGFAADMLTRIVEPGQHAVDMLDTWPTLTRMYTTISPAEMTEDPFFHENPDLPDVDLTNAIAQRFVRCDGDEVWTLPDGREVYAPNGVWPSFDDEMPWEEEVEEIGNAGAPIGLVDNSALIDQKLFEHNCMYDWPSPEVCGNPPGGTTTGGIDSGGTIGDGTVGDATGGTDSAGADGGDTSSSCACSAGPHPMGALGAFVLLALGLQLRHRTDRRDP